MNLLHGRATPPTWRDVAMEEINADTREGLLRANGLERTVRTMLGEPIAAGQADVATAFVESAT